MTQTIHFSDYKFDITLEPTNININIFNSKTMDLFEGSINQNDIYINPLDKFYKMLSNGLESKPGFTFSIESLTDKLKCKLNYTTEFIDLEEIFVVNKKANNKAVEYHLNNKIEVLEEKNKLLNNQIDFLKTELQQLKSSIQLLEKYVFIPMTWDHFDFNGTKYLTPRSSHVPINNCIMVLQQDGIGISAGLNNVFYPNGDFIINPLISNGCHFSLDNTVVLKLAPFNPNKIKITNLRLNSSFRNIWSGTEQHKVGVQFLTQYLSSKQNVIFDEINIENTSNDIIYVLTQFKNYKMVSIKKQVEKIPSDYKYIETHCKDNGIQFILT
jgi:hypothetical protein